MTYKGTYIVVTEKDRKTKQLFEKRVKHGKGVLTWQDGRKYQGEFALDKLHGDGVMSWPSGERYAGRYCNNFKNGLGKLIFADNSTFEGNWYDGKRHGDFVCYDPRHGSVKMVFQMDEVVSQTFIPAKATWAFKPGYDTFVKGEGTDDPDTCEECEETSCSICVDEIRDGDTCTRTSCKHVFHKGCMDTWMSRKLECPLCRQEVHLFKLHLSTRCSESECGCDVADEHAGTSQESHPSQDYFTGKFVQLRLGTIQAHQNYMAPSPSSQTSAPLGMVCE
jgi:hypothetical protein